MQPEGFFVASYPAFFHHFSIAFSHAVVTEPVSQINPHGLAWSLFPLRSSVTLLHWLVSFAPRVRCGQHLSSFRETSRLIPSEADFLSSSTAGLKACSTQFKSGLFCLFRG